ncbi:MAG TPA: hypothetical protein VM262_21340 [Acidimicrobiales bacterium]|nr:hypothetical protein [Acidimicrobiales bacterium]
MTRASLRWGALGAALLAAFYVTVLTWASGWSHLVAQTRQDWWLLVPITVGFGTQVALMVELRRRHRAHHLAPAAGAGTGASAMGMVACCAHHLAELAPLAGATGMAVFLYDWRVPFMLVGIGVNAVAVTIAVRRLRRVLVATGAAEELHACAA